MQKIKAILTWYLYTGPRCTEIGQVVSRDFSLSLSLSLSVHFFLSYGIFTGLREIV